MATPVTGDAAAVAEAVARSCGRGRPCVVTTVVRIDASAPRDVGAARVVISVPEGASSGVSAVGSIGGGRLEDYADDVARRMLASPAAARRPRLERVRLADVGQRCGGDVDLLFEPVAPGPASAAAWRGFADTLTGGASVHRRVTADVTPDSDGLSTGPEPSTIEVRTVLPAETFPVVVLGEGHVGKAIVRELTPLGAQIISIGVRDAGEKAVAAAVVAGAPPNASYLVVTHDHDLDLDLTEAILRRGDAAYVGLIGSEAKRRYVCGRLRERGLTPGDIAALTCPIGLPGIPGKAPGHIAVAVAAQLLLLRASNMPSGVASHGEGRVPQGLDGVGLTVDRDLGDP